MKIPFKYLKVREGGKVKLKQSGLDSDSDSFKQVVKIKFPHIRIAEVGEANH